MQESLCVKIYSDMFQDFVECGCREFSVDATYCPIHAQLGLNLASVGGPVEHMDVS